MILKMRQGGGVQQKQIKKENMSKEQMDFVQKLVHVKMGADVSHTQANVSVLQDGKDFIAKISVVKVPMV